MCTPGWVKRTVFLLAGGLVLAGAMGQGCPSFFFPPVDGTEELPVTVELINVTGNPVDPFLWADPDILFAPEEVAIPANLVDIGPPLEPDEVATVELSCFDAGTLLFDGDLLLPDGSAVLSDNLIILNEGDLFFCGDVVSAYYEVDEAGVFFISVDVNDFTVAP